MDAEIKGNMLIVTIELEAVPRPSSTGKTLVVSTTGGFKKTTATVNGKQVSVAVNAVIPRN